MTVISWIKYLFEQGLAQICHPLQPHGCMHQSLAHSESVNALCAQSLVKNRLYSEPGSAKSKFLCAASGSVVLNLFLKSRKSLNKSYKPLRLTAANEGFSGSSGPHRNFSE